MMKKGFLMVAAATLAIASLRGPAHAEGAKGTKEEAVAMVKKAIDHIKADGKDKAFADFTAGMPPFKDRDMYVFVWDSTGKNLAHGGNPKLVGKDLSELKDGEGFEIGKAFLSAAKNSPKGSWVNYRWPNSVTKALEPKTTWIVANDNLLVGVGISAAP